MRLVPMNFYLRYEPLLKVVREINQPAYREFIRTGADLDSLGWLDGFPSLGVWPKPTLMPKAYLPKGEA